MDRLQFVGSINGGGNNNDQFFEHTMIAYDMVGSINDIAVSSNAYIDGGISFKFIFGNHDDYQKVSERIMNEFHDHVNLYGSVFKIDVISNNESTQEIVVRILQL